ncbi:MAG TPA: kelch repeat-containing protein [Gemmatimonadales bacterium]|nr:kelch repeat-containing protein [Gemmatimonadales bacterium]
MSWWRGWRSGLVLALLLVGMLAAAAAGFWAGRRVPHGLLARLRSHAAPLSAWAPQPDAPMQVFESPVAVVDGQLYVFGGFTNAKVQASGAVWQYDPASGRWTRKRDLPSRRTHVNPARVGEALWFAGGFVGDDPGPATDEVWRYDWRADRWTPGPPLPEPIAGGVLLSLRDTLHFFGGFRRDRNTNSAAHWVLAPRDAGPPPVWTSAAPLPKPRGHLGGAVLDGALYAIGGCVGHDPNPVDVPWVHRYDPATDRWTEVAPLPFPRSHFEPSVVVRAGRIVVLGGRSWPRGLDALDDVTEYDPGTDRWLARPPLPEPRLSPIAVLLGDRILAGLGGRHTSNPDNHSLWLEQRDSAWLPGPILPVPLGEVSAGVVGNRLFLLGQGDAATLALDLGSGRWDPVASHAVRPAPGDHHGLEVWNGRLYLLGGLGRGQGVVQVYDPAADQWHNAAPMPFAAGSSATAVLGDYLYAAGGIVGDSTTRLAARFDPRSESWSPIAPLPLARNHAASGTDGRRWYVFGGRGPGSGDGNVVANGFAEVQIYDPGTDRWSVSGEGPGAPAPLPQARGGMGKAVYAGGEFWVFGGETKDGAGAARRGVYDRVDVYDPVRNTWRAGPRLPTPRHGIFPVLVGDHILVLGGGVHSGHSESIVAEALELGRQSATARAP